MMVSFVVHCNKGCGHIMGVWLHCAGLLEINELLGDTRQLSTEVQWEWQANDGEWKEYAATENRMIEVRVDNLVLALSHASVAGWICST